jgi:regulator of RNase E activity RraA
MNRPLRYALRCATSDACAPLARCWVEVASDGSGVVVVDGEPLFRASALSAMMAHYGLVRGERVHA